MNASDNKPSRCEVCIEEISAHIEKYIGKVAAVFHEIRSDAVHIDLHHVKPTEDNPFNILVTSGMSDLPMKVPPDANVPRYIELMAILPRDWRMDQESFKTEEWYWPVRLLKILARYPHRYNTWLGWGHTIPNGRPSRPFAANTQLSGVIIFPSVIVPREFHELRINEEKTIHFYSIMPLYEDEMKMKIHDGSKMLFDKFDACGITDFIDLERKNVVKVNQGA
jgi:hypothetical protein